MSETGAAGIGARDQGMSLMKLGRFADAAIALGRAVEADPSDETSWRLLGGARASSGDHDGAVKAFARSIELAPDSAKAHYNYALSLQAVGQSYEAKQHLERALALEPTYEQATLRLREIQNAATNASGGVGSGEAGGIPGLGGKAKPDDLAPVGAFRPQTAPKNEGSTNIGGGDTDGLAPVGTSFVQAGSPKNEGSTNIGGGDMGGLSSVGGGYMPSLPSNPSANNNNGAAASGNTGGLSGVGGSNTIGGVSVMPNNDPRPVMSAPLLSTNPSPYDAPKPVLGMQYGIVKNTSGTGEPAPPGVAGGFNLGAAVFPWFWLWSHNLKVYGSIWFGFNFLARFLVTFGGVAGTLIVIILDLVLRIGLGLNANRWGWENRYFNDVEDFKKCERIWMYWAIPFALIFGLIYVLAIIGIAAGAGGGHRSNGIE